ncbi:protein mono-ADP-ribosyltransferase PARP14-like isoform X2 [Colossoma macropomum]|uniref:protein mono-ADP-ribosyltransferase PARP14-like isoform X2 n=1 Tax=Colossoma macropomum TaxID=42526 RepID=UPI0018656AFA|nr:protein mono-ADP-ribosyltransferase PARP14-like isoform X2 [Colossoma macropomum]
MDLIILNKVNFIKWLREDLLILQHVQSRKLVTMDEYTKLKNIRDSSERINELLDTILSKGNLFCLNFLNLLKEDGVNASSPQLKEWISTINNSAVRSQEEPPAKDEEPPAAESETEEAEDQEPVVNKVLSAQHQIQKHRIRVFPYYESLGTALCGKDRPTLRLPETFTKNIDKSVWKYLQDNPGSLDLIKREMRKHFCQLDFRDAAVKISPLASLLNQGLQSGKLVETWRENASAEFTATMSKYKSLEIFVQRDAWSETEAEIHKTLFAKPVTMVFQKDQGTVMLAGLAEDVSRTGDVIQITIDRITHRIQREKGSVTDEITMVPSIYELVMLDGLEQEISNSFPEMELSYHSHSKKLALYGLKQEVLESKNKILQEVIGLKRRMVELHPSILEFLTRRDQEELKWDLLLSKGIRASLEIKENRALLVAKTEKTLKDSEERLKAVLNHKCLDVEDPGVLRKAEWQDLIICLNNLFNSPVMTVVIITSGSQIMVAGFDDVVELVLEQLSDFVHNNSNLVATIEADRTVVRFIQEHKKQDWLAKVKNKVNIDFKDGKILLSGPRVHVSQCKPVFENMISSVYHCSLKVVKPGAKKLFESKELLYVAAAKEQIWCLVELIDEHEVFQAGLVSIGQKRFFTPEGVEIVVSKGNMCFYPVDAVVIATNENQDFNKGLSKALSDAAGPQLQDACRQILKIRKQPTTGDAVLTKAGGQLCCKYIIHTVGPHYDSSNPKRAVRLLKKAVKRSLYLADRESCQSVAVPVISSGDLGFPLDLVADTIVVALNEFFEFVSGDSCLKKIHLVENNDRTVEALEAAVQKVYGGSSVRQVSRSEPSHHQQNLNLDFGDEFHNRINIQSATPGPTMQQQIKEKDDQQQKGGGFVIKGKVVNPACFSICGPSKAAVDQTKQWIEKLISDKHVFEIISDPVIFSLSNKDQQQILELQQSLDVSVRVEHKVQGEDQEEATILVEGLSRDVLKAVSEIQTILKKARDEVGLKKNMKVISELVDWQYLQSGQYQSFNQLTNLHLEQALAKKSLHVDISLHGQAYKVTMPEGPALSAEGGNQISIRRIDKIQVVASDSLPQEWDPMTATELFKECPLQDNGHEYNDVLSHFGKTCPNNNILKISRIQNPGMWRKYQHNKHIMEIKNGHKNNEKRLFHGTRAVSMKHINHSGFNRSYAGMNAAAYGRGTYFALNASYSAINTYSVPNQQGHKHMYLCRVLTGDYTPGNASVIVPPLKSANGTDLFDSTVDNVSAPTIFVVFRDDHAYPEYLITFT